MSFSKRIFDLVLASTLLVVLLPIILVLVVILLVMEGRPVFYLSERMKTPTTDFTLIKFRTMRHSGLNTGVTGGDKLDRISGFQGFLRGNRLDEVPQLINIIRGDMSFVGPRPPLRVYVEDFIDLYTDVLRSRPGVTGLATIKVHGYEERILAGCSSAEETDLIYRRRCIPKKAAIDLAYQKNASLCFDLKIIAATAFKPLNRR